MRCDQTSLSFAPNKSRKRKRFKQWQKLLIGRNLIKGRSLFVHVVPPSAFGYANTPLNVEVADVLRLVFIRAQGYHSKLFSMALISTVLGFSAFGLASRFGQLAIQRRNLMDSVLFSTEYPTSIHLTRFPFRLGWTRHCNRCIWICRLLGTPLRNTNERTYCMETCGNTSQGGR